MRCAVMQPYIFPYIGYFQLACSVDYFVFYDDVNFIKRGFINRNNILANGAPLRITFPVVGASQNKLISELEFSLETQKLESTIHQNYSKAPYYRSVMPLIESTLHYNNRNIADLCKFSFERVIDYLGLSIDIELSSSIDYNRSLSAADKLIEITKLLKCSTYVNPIGGRHLYEKEYFEEKGVDLLFLDVMEHHYYQGSRKDKFIANLSIIDVLMWCSIKSTKDLLAQFRLI